MSRKASTARRACTSAGFCTVELPDAVVAVILLDEALEDLSGDKLSNLGENILAVVHNQWFTATKLRTHFKSRLSKNCRNILKFNNLQA